MKKKKGFTLVELLVVIAILAVLATVSVVGYMGFTKKAKESNDIGLTTQMNTILQSEEVTNKPTTPHEAVKQLANGGVDVEKLTPTTDGYNYVYDLDANRMFLLDDNKAVVSPTNIEYTVDLNVFAFVESESEITNWNGYSIYLKSGFKFNNSKTLTLSTGLDVGDIEIDTINYERKNATNKQTVLIRTTDGLLNVDAEKDTINHYGSIDEVNVINCAMNSYHVFGKVIGTINLEKGHVDIEKTGKVGNVNIKSESTDDFIVSNEKGGDLGFVKSDNPEIITSSNVKVTEQTGVMTSKNKDAIAYSEAKGFLTEWDSVLGNGKTTLLTDLEDKVYYLSINANVNAIFDLNGHKFLTDESGKSYVLGKLVFMDSSNGETGLYYCKVNYINDGQDKCVLKAIGENSLLTIENGTIEARNANNTFDDNNGQFGLGVQDGGNIIINGGTIKAGWYAIAGNGSSINSSSIIINGGRIISVCDYAIYLPHVGVTTINGGIIDGAAGAISLNRGSLTINNGKFSSDGTGDVGNWGDGTGANTCNALINSNAGYGDTTIIVNGGEFNVKKLNVFAVGQKYNSSISINSGTYNKYIDRWVTAGYTCVDNGDGTWSVIKQ